MPRIKTTKLLSDRIWRYTNKMGTYRCPEVTINHINERVDLLTYEPRGKIWRFYEVKSCKQDFYSNSKWTFLGQYNYFVMEKELFDQVKDDIPDHVGVMDGHRSLKRAKKQDLQIKEDALMWYFTRSLSTQLNSEIEVKNRLSKELESMKYADNKKISYQIMRG